MKPIRLLLSLLFAVPVCCLCQPSVTRTDSQLLFINTHPQKTTRFAVQNTTDDTIYIWIQKVDTSCSGINNFRKYFFSSLSDFSLSTLCFDSSVSFDVQFVPVIGVNFIKKMSPKDTFNIYLLNCDMEESAVHYTTLEKVREIVSPQRLDDFIYNHDYVVIDTIDF